MPVPSKEQLDIVVKGLMMKEGLKGENIGNLAEAIAQIINKSLTDFVSQVQVAPGIPATPAATTAPGKLV